MANIYAKGIAVTKEFTFNINSTTVDNFRVIITRPDASSPTKRGMFAQYTGLPVGGITTSWDNTTKKFLITIDAGFNSIKGTYKFDILYHSLNNTLNAGTWVYKSFGYILI